MQNQNSNSSCGSCVGMVMFLGLVAIFVYFLIRAVIDIWKFFTEPGLGHRLVDVIGGLGICLGAIIVVLFLLSKVPESWFGDHIDDWYN